jgi:sugar phosphate permease
MCRCYYGKLVWKRRVKNRDKIFLLFIYFSSRGLIFGVWSACASVGNILGAAVAAAFLGYGYEYPFLVCCVLLMCCAIICFFAIVPSPEDVGMYKTKRTFFV